MKALTVAVTALALAAQSVSGQRGTIADTAAVGPVSSSGMLYVLREERHAGSPYAQTYPLATHTCVTVSRADPRGETVQSARTVRSGWTVQSGWLVMRGSWWVVVDTVGTCPASGSFRLATFVDSGLVGGTPDGRGWVLMRGGESPLPGPAAMLWQSFSYLAAHRFSDTLTMVGADSSHLKIYVRPREP
jgi:hypothetical protein